MIYRVPNGRMYLFLLLFSFCAHSLSAQRIRSTNTAKMPTTYTQPSADEFLAQVNTLRTTGCNCGGRQMKAVAPLTWNTQLAASAQAHADDMRTKNYFSHDSRDGRSMDERITAQGYKWQACGENIASGQTSLQEVMQSWIKSTGHCRQMMSADVTEMGAARSKNGDYWVQDFGKPF